MKDAHLPSLASLQAVCLQQQIPFVSFRLPDETDITTFVQYNTFPTKVVDLLNTSKGYVISPFTTLQGADSYLLQPDRTFRDNDIPAEIISELSRNEQFKSVLTDCKPKTTPQEEFEQNVNKAIEHIKAGVFRKVVVSKTQLVDIPDNFSAAVFYQKLCTTYPSAYVYCIQLPKVGCWIGATPEPLLTSKNKHMFTVSIAGTQQFTGLTLNKYFWKEKELDEQQIVTNFIANTLASNGIKNFKESKAENYRAGNLIHLKSGFEFESVDVKNQLSKLINSLHPTPSTGGLPKKEAREFILNTESHERAYYTGFLGTLDPKKGCQLYVNLRCMQILEQKIVLYSGAGITASSDAGNEWIETENKMQTLKSIITAL